MLSKNSLCVSISRYLIISFVILVLIRISIGTVNAGCISHIWGGCNCGDVCTTSTQTKCSVSGSSANEKTSCPNFGLCCEIQYICDTGPEAKAICGGGAPQTCTNGNCDSSSCGWNGNANCNDFGGGYSGAHDKCDTIQGCSWNSTGPNYWDGFCTGRYCQVDNSPGNGCFSFANNKALCQGSGCNWTQLPDNTCADACSLNGKACGQMQCHDSCTNALVNATCPSVSCATPTPTPTPTATPTPSPTPAPTPTPTPTPAPTPNTNGAWFQTKGGDVHANGMIGTTIPATCGMICSIGNFLSRILSIFGS